VWQTSSFYQPVGCPLAKRKVRGRVNSLPPSVKMTTAKDVLKQLRPHLETNTVANDINRKRRGYFIKLKVPLLNAFRKVGQGCNGLWLFLALIQIAWLARKFPEPTRDRVRKINSHALMDIFDEYVKYEKDGRIRAVVSAFRRLIIGMIEHSSPYTQRVNWFAERLGEKILNGDWKPDHPWNPAQAWDEPSVLIAQDRRNREIIEKFNRCKEILNKA